MFSALHITLHPTFIYGSDYTGHTGLQKMHIKRQEGGGGLLVIEKDWSAYAFREISLVLLFICSVSLLMIVGLVVLIGMVVIRLLNVFAEINTASQAMRLDINKLLRKASNLTESERQAFTQFEEVSRKP